jgi:hypothetical protein
MAKLHGNYTAAEALAPFVGSVTIRHGSSRVCLPLHPLTEGDIECPPLEEDKGGGKVTQGLLIARTPPPAPPHRGGHRMSSFWRRIKEEVK